MIPIEVIAFLVGHITGWGEGTQQVTMKDLVVSGAWSAVMSLILTFLLGLAIPALGGDPITSIMGAMTDPGTIFVGSIASAVTGFVGTYWGYFTRVGQEQFQRMY